MRNIVNGTVEIETKCPSPIHLVAQTFCKPTVYRVLIVSDAEFGCLFPAAEQSVEIVAPGGCDLSCLGL